jgi:hypothetical protein
MTLAIHCHAKLFARQSNCTCSAWLAWSLRGPVRGTYEGSSMIARRYLDAAE